jgi:predicted ATPase/transcriptional regulator with XRE-family HTH domain
MEKEFFFGEWIRKRRNLLGLTREALAKRVGYSIAMVRKIEDDERRPSPQAAALLAQALEIPAEQQHAFLMVARQERPVDRLGPVEKDEPFPWQIASAPQTNLPLPTTPFVGREAEVASLAELLLDPACRLVTLVGLAGTGKTRFALQVARNQLDRFPHGVFFVSLAPLTSPEMIVTGIGSAIGFQFHEGGEPQDQLLRYLREKQMLLVLDNFEHLMEGAGLLPAILQAAPGVRILVTSRERLNLQGEWVHEVEGLPYPSGQEGSTPDPIEAYEAVRLFVQSALRVRPDFNLSEENREWVAKICQLTEGLPLGIELAAAWVRALSCKQIAWEIECSLDILKAYARDVPERHRSLRAALDHSFDLLSSEEKAVFGRLSVFRGGFRREAAQEVAGAGLEVLASLLDKSLLRRTREERYDLHELVRQYAASHLQSDPDEEFRTHELFSDYYAARLEAWGMQIFSQRQVEALEEMDAEIDNGRLAWDWMVSHQQVANIRKSLRSIWRYHDIRGRFQDGLVLMRQATDAIQAIDETETTRDTQRAIVLGRVLAQQAYLCIYIGRYTEAQEALQKSLALLLAGADRAALAYALLVRGYMQSRLGELPDARQHAEESLVLYRALGNHDELVYCLVTLAFIHLSQGNYQQAYQLSSEGLAICNEPLGDPLAREHCLLSLGAAASHLNHPIEAKRWLEESLQISRVLNHRSGSGEALKWLGLIHQQMGEDDRAEALLRQSAAQFKEIGDLTRAADTLVDLGGMTRAAGAISQAKQILLIALQMAIETRAHHTMLQAMLEMAGIEMKEGNPELALELVMHCLHVPSIEREFTDRTAALYAELAAQLTTQQIETAELRGRTRSLESWAQETLAAG